MRRSFLAAFAITGMVCLFWGNNTVKAEETASAGMYLPGDKVAAVLGEAEETGVTMVKAGTSIILKGKVKNAKTKYTIWRLRQQYDNIVDLTTMEAEAYKKLEEIEKEFSNELALSFDVQAQENLSKSLRFRVVEGRLVVSGKVNNKVDIERIGNIAKLYDKRPVINVEARQDMIEIDAIFCRIGRNNGNNFGATGLQTATITMPNYSVSYLGSTNSSFAAASSNGSGSFKNNGWTSAASFGSGSTINTLAAKFEVTENDVKLLVRPHLSTLNGKEAVFHSGGQQPFTIVTTEVQNIVWKDYGTKLTVLPEITTDGKIDISVTLEFTIPLGDSLNRYTRFNHTGRAILEGNQAMVLSGLVQQLYSMDVDRTPGISKVPILNFFFGNKNRTHDQSEMVVVVMPRISTQKDQTGLKGIFRDSTHSTKVVENIQDKMGDVPDRKDNARKVVPEKEGSK